MSNGTPITRPNKGQLVCSCGHDVRPYTLIYTPTGFRYESKDGLRFSRWIFLCKLCEQQRQQSPVWVTTLVRMEHRWDKDLERRLKLGEILDRGAEKGFEVQGT
jgi:hypothetical protein